MKKYINIKKSMQNHVRNVQLAAVAVAGLGITVFCTAECPYTVPEGCSPEIQLLVKLNSGSGCGTVNVSSLTTCDDIYDTITCAGGSGTSPTIPALVEEDGSIIWDGQPTVVTLATGINKLVANSCELNKSSSEVDVRSSGSSGPTSKINVTAGCPLESTSHCGAYIDFVFSCLTPGHSYTWSETITGDSTCSSCDPGTPFTWNEPSSGGCILNDTAQAVCPSGITHGECDTTCYQSWSLVDNTGGPGLSGTTTREYKLNPTVPSTTVIVTGDGSGTTVCN